MGYNALINYLNRIRNKRNCARTGCSFASISRPMILIPPPSTIKIAIISRDPPYGFFQNWYNPPPSLTDPGARAILFCKGIPYALARRIDRVSGNVRTFRRVWNIFLKCAYWTHMHKCPTGGGNPYKLRNATACADAYICNELINATNNLEKIIALGSDVANWLLKKKLKLKRKLSMKDLLAQNQPFRIKICNTKNLDVFVLPHPSPRNRIWNHPSKQLRKTVNRLLRNLYSLTGC